VKNLKVVSQMEWQKRFQKFHMVENKRFLLSFNDFISDFVHFYYFSVLVLLFNKKRYG